MTVQQLIDLLSECDPEATVRIMMQESWPFECAIEGIAVREDFSGEECECNHRIMEPHDEGCPAGGDSRHENGLSGSDVFIVEGPQERYGDRTAWAVSRRPW